jgi:hypothetical protein
MEPGDIVGFSVANTLRAKEREEGRERGERAHACVRERAT